MPWARHFGSGASWYEKEWFESVVCDQNNQQVVHRNEQRKRRKCLSSNWSSKFVGVTAGRDPNPAVHSSWERYQGLWGLWVVKICPPCPDLPDRRGALQTHKHKRPLQRVRRDADHETISDWTGAPTFIVHYASRSEAGELDIRYGHWRRCLANSRLRPVCVNKRPRRPAV